MSSLPNSCLSVNCLSFLWNLGSNSGNSQLSTSELTQFIFIRQTRGLRRLFPGAVASRVGLRGGLGGSQGGPLSGAPTQPGNRRYCPGKKLPAGRISSIAPFPSTRALLCLLGNCLSVSVYLSSINVTNETKPFA